MTNGQLRRLCVENDWFNCGTVEQYEKMLNYNEGGAFISQLAMMIWICSDEELDDITRRLEEAEEKYQRIREACENEQ